MKGGGTQGLVSISRNNFVGCFVTPFPSCDNPALIPTSASSTSSSSLVMCPWLVVRTTPAARGDGTEPGQPQAPAGMVSILRSPLEVGDSGPWRRGIGSGLPRSNIPSP